MSAASPSYFNSEEASAGQPCVFTGENVVWLLINEVLSGLHVPFLTQQYVFSKSLVLF